MFNKIKLNYPLRVTWKACRNNIAYYMVTGYTSWNIILQD